MPQPTRVRAPVFAGRFYPDDGRELRAAVRRYVEAAEGDDSHPAAAIIGPHAGFRYSGPIAGTAYATLASRRGEVERVVLLGPSHRVAFDGIALPIERSFATPLGVLNIDRAAATLALEHPVVREFAAAHAEEHGLEVHLPFIQEVLGDVPLVPLVVGSVRAEDTAAVIEALWPDDRTLVIVSSDLSHFHDAETARGLDRGTADAIEAGAPVDPDGACGHAAINGLLPVVRRRGLVAETLDLRNSADTAGTPESVVGYGAFRFTARAP